MNVDLILADLRGDEGVRVRPYDDATGKDFKIGDTLQGNLTVGIGRNLSSVIFNDSEIEFMGRNDIERAALVLDHFIPEWRGYTENRQRGLVNMAFNMGYDLGAFVKMLAALKAGDFDTASAEAWDSKWRTQVGDARATRVTQWIKNG